MLRLCQLNPYADPDLSESRTRANASFAFRVRSLLAPVLLPTLLGAYADAITAASSLLQNRHQIPGEMWCTLRLFFASLASVTVRVEGAVMRIIVVAAVLAASCLLGGCFHFHTSQVYSAPQPLPPLK